MFQKINQQKVQNTNGYIVQVANRTTIEYFDEHYHAYVNVDFGLTVGLYKKSLRINDKEEKPIQIPDLESQEIFERIILGVEAMGSQVERC